MSSRDKILQAVRISQLPKVPLPADYQPLKIEEDLLTKYVTVMESIGAKVYRVKEEEDLMVFIEGLFPEAKRMVSSVTFMERLLIKDHKDVTPASLSDVEVGIIEAKMGVAENGAVWVTEEELKVRALPFICEHLVALVKEEDIVSNMHEAYERIREGDYGFGVFIAGPSKTADIEQSLVLGAHGPKTMTVLIRTKE